MVRKGFLLGPLAVTLALVVASGAHGAPLGQVTDFHDGIAGGEIEDVVAGSDGNLWFTNSMGPTIGRITPGGQITQFSAGLNPGSKPFQLTAGPDGNLWFTDGGSTPAIGKITISGEITEYSLGAGSEPIVITTGADGNLWFADSGTPPAIGRITTAGQVTWFTTGLNPGSQPTGITAGPDGNLWFTDGGTTGAVGRITPAGQITNFTAGLTAKPAYITAGPDGNLWFTNDSSATQVIGRITINGTVTEFTDNPPITTLYDGDITTGPDGNLWLTDTSASGIVRITTSGQITEFIVRPAQEWQPFGITTGADGNLWFTIWQTTAANAGVGRFGVGEQAASLRAPSVTGSGQAGTQAVCQGDRWATWAGRQPNQNPPHSNPPGVQWLLDGAPVGGATGASYTPATAEIGKALACRVSVTYPLLGTTASATSSPVTVLAQSQGPQGQPGPQGSPGTTVICKQPSKKRKKKRKKRKAASAAC